MFNFIQDSLDKIRAKKWAEPMGQVLGVTAQVVDCVGNFVPGVGMIGAALKLGADLLNPEPSIQDLENGLKEIRKDLGNNRQLSARARKLLEKEKSELENTLANIITSQSEIRTDMIEVKNDVQSGFKAIASDLKSIEKDVSEIKDKISATYDIVCDIQYRNGIDRIEATYEAFTAGSADVEKVIQRFHQFAMEIQTEYYQHMKTGKIRKYLQIVLEKDGQEVCLALYEYVIQSYIRVIVLLSKSPARREMEKMISNLDSAV